jgi:hypothetical protein
VTLTCAKIVSYRGRGLFVVDSVIGANVLTRFRERAGTLVIKLAPIKARNDQFLEARHSGSNHGEMTPHRFYTKAQHEEPILRRA